MMSQNDDSIWVVTPSSDVEHGPGAAYRGVREIKEQVIRKGIQIPAANLKSNFESFFKNVISLMSELPEGKFPFTVEEIEISAEISGEGKIQLVGGITAGAKGGITFKLKRVKSN